jgi:hypothetical protein
MTEPPLLQRTITSVCTRPKLIAIFLCAEQLGTYTNEPHGTKRQTVAYSNAEMIASAARGSCISTLTAG